MCQLALLFLKVIQYAYFASIISIPFFKSMDFALLIYICFPKKCTLAYYIICILHVFGDTLKYVKLLMWTKIIFHINIKLSAEYCKWLPFLNYVGLFSHLIYSSLLKWRFSLASGAVLMGSNYIRGQAVLFFFLKIHLVVFQFNCTSSGRHASMCMSTYLSGRVFFPYHFSELKAPQISICSDSKYEFMHLQTIWIIPCVQSIAFTQTIGFIITFYRGIVVRYHQWKPQSYSD